MKKSCPVCAVGIVYASFRVPACKRCQTEIDSAELVEQLEKLTCSSGP